MKRVRYFSMAVMMLGVMMSVGTHAASEKNNVDSEPAKVVDEVTRNLLTIAKTKKSLLETNPNAYFAEIRALLTQAVDFESIAKGVMGKTYWLKTSTADQEAFIHAFTDSLVKTYGKGMANFADLDVTVESAVPNPRNADFYNVIQSVKTDDGASKIIYSMGRDDKGWRLKNVILNGVNLGKTFRSQFSQAVKESDGDISKAIASWGKEES